MLSYDDEKLYDVLNGCLVLADAEWRKARMSNTPNIPEPVREQLDIATWKRESNDANS